MVVVWLLYMVVGVEGVLCLLRQHVSCVVCRCVCVCVCVCVCYGVYTCIRVLCVSSYVTIGISCCSIKPSTNAHGHTSVATTLYSCCFVVPISRCVMMKFSLLNNSVGAVKPNSIGQQLRYFESSLRLSITFEVTLHMQLAPVCT